MLRFRGGLLIMFIWAVAAVTTVPVAGIQCTTVTEYMSACSGFITYGSPDPLPGSPCCEAIRSLSNISSAGGETEKVSVCRCFMGIIFTYNPNATAIATLPGFCGVSLGFVIDPNADCSYVPLHEARGS